jgi:hypothetical protein
MADSTILGINVASDCKEKVFHSIGFDRGLRIFRFASACCGAFMDKKHAQQHLRESEGTPRH